MGFPLYFGWHDTWNAQESPKCDYRHTQAEVSPAPTSSDA